MFQCTTSNDNKNIESEQQDSIEIIYNGHIYVKCEADSIKGNFAFDTGCDILLLDSTYFHSNQFLYTSLYSDTIYGIGNSKQLINYITKPVNFKYSGLEYSSDYTPIVNIKDLVGDYIDGIFGTNYYKNKIIEINYEKKFLKVHSNFNSFDISSYKSILLTKVDNYFCVPINININDSAIISGKMILDTGSPSTIISNITSNKNDLSKKIKDKIYYNVTTGGFGGSSSGYYFITDKIKLGSFELNKVNMSFSLDSAGILSQDKYIGVLGNDILEKFDIIIDFIYNKLYLRPNLHYNEENKPSRLGFTYINKSLTQDGWIVSGLYDNTKAVELGLNLFDTIISINDINVKSIEIDKDYEFIDKLDTIKIGIKKEDQIKFIKYKLLPIINNSH